MRKFKIFAKEVGDIRKINDGELKPSGEISLHQDILDILFKHKEEVYKKLIDLRGIFLIDHIAIKIIDPCKRIAIFSMSPSVEYNLIVQNLWKHDLGFSYDFQRKNLFYSWESAYTNHFFNEIKSIKEIKHGFTFGFNIPKKINDYMLIYSYATRYPDNNLFKYYKNHIRELTSLGDYGYRLIRNIYQKYCVKEAPICVNNLIYREPLLRLITKNEI